MTKPNNIIVRAGADRYPVMFGEYRARMSELTRQCSRIVVVSNPTVFALHGKDLTRRFFRNNRRLVSVMIGDGERYKNQRTVDALYEQFFDIGIDRYDMIVAFGGGVVGDTAGYGAATFKRGVPFVQVPTTLLAMVDASIGGKVGINHRFGKNQIGTFYQPTAVMIEPKWLATLGQREMVDGLAEILKAGFLSSERLVKAATAAVENPVYSAKTKAAISDLITRAVRFKARVISRDVNDYGIRRILNFGHTFAHAIEKAEGYGRIHHGEAVLAGMVGAIALSLRAGSLTKSLTDKYLDYLRLWVSHVPVLKAKIEDYFEALAVDKKNRGRTPVFVLLEEIGRPVVREAGNLQQVFDAIDYMRAWVNSRGAI